MAGGTGPAPKDPAQRRRRNEPARGEWIELPPLEKAVLPLLPDRRKAQGRWSAQTRTAWLAWRRDPATTQYGPAEVQSAVDLAYLYEEWARGDYKLAAEIRLRMDGLGLTPKGKRDLRWRVPPRAELVQLDQEREQRTAQKRSRIKAVETAKA